MRVFMCSEIGPWWLISILPCLVHLALCDTSCSSSLPAPIAIPVRNVTLANNLLARGAFVSVGSPPQSLAFAPADKWNNTYVFDASTVARYSDISANACSNSFGGFFDEGKSTTYTKASSRAASGAASETFPYHKDDVYGRDTLELNATLSFANHPIGVEKTRVNNQNILVDSQNILGLGRNSTLLNTLFSNGSIASRTYAWWRGWTGAEASQQMDGSLTFGGYDSAKITGKNITLPFSNNVFDCLGGLIVTITDIQMNLRNGSDIGILGVSRSSAMKACLATSYNVIDLPEDIWNAFVNVSKVTPAENSRSGGTNFWGMLIDADGAYDGDLTFSLAPGLDIRIPNHQLVVPNYVYGDNGELVIQNGTTEREVVINSLQDISKNQIPNLGGPFMASAYLIVDQDHQEFTLAQAHATDTQDLVPIGPPACNSAEPISPTTSSAPSQTPSQPSTPRHSIRAAAVAGGTVGGVAFVIGLSLATFCVMRKRHARQRMGNAGTNNSSNEKGDGSQEAFKPEMPSDHTHQPAAELPLERHPRYDMAPYEMPSGGSDGRVPRYEMPAGGGRGNTTPHELL